MSAQFNQIKSVEELNEVFAQSKEKPVVLFKHSLTCPISAGVYEVVRNVEGEVHIVIMQNAREVSNEIAARTGIRHESPQAIVLKDEKPIYHASHYDITADEVNGNL
ncbi:MAG: bacillithiol system redox-active protein YtxJ [Pyrinomonadaceae bacterium]